MLTEEEYIKQIKKRSYGIVDKENRTISVGASQEKWLKELKNAVQRTTKPKFQRRNSLFQGMNSTKPDDTPNKPQRRGSLFQGL